MRNNTDRSAPMVKVVVAFATVYIVWGSTYFFIRLSVAHIPPMLVGVLRYLTAGVLLLTWCLLTGKPVFSRQAIGPAFVSGFLLLCGGNGVLIWSEQYLPNSLAAILLASGPIWFVVLDRRMWRVNFRSRSTIAGLVMGFIGVLLLFGDGGLRASGKAVGMTDMERLALGILIVGSISWAAGSLYSKYRSTPVSNSVNAGWQMLLGGLVFVVASFVSGEWNGFQMRQVPVGAGDHFGKCIDDQSGEICEEREGRGGFGGKGGIGNWGKWVGMAAINPPRWAF